MSKSIYAPHFYIIQHINSGKYYAGVRYGKNANPDQLLKFNGYQTSSNIVKQIILEEGLDFFIIRKIKIFETADQALEYELRFLRKVNAAFNDSFLNRTNNSLSTINVDYEKVKQTCLENFGVEYPLQSEKIREKHKQTCLEKYGFENPSCVPEIREKQKQTCLEKYGVKYTQQSEEIRNKSKQTMLQNHGVENPNQVPEFQEKKKQTCLRKYGYEYSGQVPDFKEKIKQTNLEKYGVEHVMQSPEIQEKYKQTSLKNYGVENPLQSEDIKEKKKQTCLKNYGVENPGQSPEVQEKKRQRRIFLSNQPIALEILKYKEKYGLKLGSYWMYKPQEIQDNLLDGLKMTYGEL